MAIEGVDGRSFCFGRKRPPSAALAMVPRLDRYAFGAPALPAPPPRSDWSPAALNASALQNVLANDDLGCCVLSACGHSVDVWRANAGTGNPVTADEVVGWYSATTGYVPGDPNTDQGSDPVAVLNYWKTTGLTGAGQIAGFVAIDSANVTLLRTAIWLFGGIMLGGELLKAWVDGMGTMQPGFIWDVGSPADPEAGHEVYGFGYNDGGILIDSWGLTGLMTWAAVKEFGAASTGGDVLCPLSQDWIEKASALAPSGFDLAALQADLAAL